MLDSRANKTFLVVAGSKTEAQVSPVQKQRYGSGSRSSRHPEKILLGD